MATPLIGQKMYRNGQWISKAEMIDVFDPQDGTRIGTVPRARAEDMLHAIEEAKEGARLAESLPIHERMAILHRAANYIERQKERYARTISREGSKTIREARKEVRRAVETLRISAEEARRIHGETIPFDQMAGSEDRIGYYERFPIGIVGAITPFNDPLNLVAHKVGPAIAAGNAIIVKPATLTPLSALLLAEAFAEAGLPARILSVITGKGRDVGDVLISHPDVRMISFTGGLETGEEITRKAGLKKLSMELGSNSPVIVLKDADVEKAVQATVSGSFSCAGQNCIGVQRIYVEEELYETFCNRFVEETEKLKVGDKQSEATDVGPMIEEREAQRVEKWVQEAILKGAKLHTGGWRNGAFFAPTVLSEVPRECTLARKEVFGPVVILSPVLNFEEAIHHANDAEYGLQAGIFTKNVNRALQASRQLQVGGVMINDSSDYRIDSMPFGGIKGSGLGREGVRFAIQEMTEPRVVCFKLTE